MNQSYKIAGFFAYKVLATWMLMVVCVSSYAQQEALPNIILCMGDDHGWDETGYNGHPYLHTPVLDEMAASGLRLDRFYSAHPSCSPTRGSVITGRHPNRYGVFSPGFSIRPEEISMARIHGEAGYECAHFGKWHLGPVKAESPTNPGGMGFDFWLSHDNFFELNPYFSHNGGPPVQFQGESSEILVEEVIRYLSKPRKKGQPFFIVLWFGSPHEPYSGLEEDLALYKDLPSIYEGQETRLTSNETGLQVERPLGEVLQERYAEITAMDRSMGRLRNWLGEAGLRTKTLLWYCGDNGTSREGIVTSPFRGEKGTMYGGGIRVPGIIEWPERIHSARTSDINTVTSDILPTLCELTAQSLPSRPLDGISLKSLIDGHMEERPQAICFWQYKLDQEELPEAYINPVLQEGTTPLVKQMGGLYTRNFRNYRYEEISEQDYKGERVILDNRYKLVLGVGDPKNRELFDILVDPAETNNLIEKLPEEAARLERQLTNWQGAVLTSLTGADYD